MRYGMETKGLYVNLVAMGALECLICLHIFPCLDPVLGPMRTCPVSPRGLFAWWMELWSSLRLFQVSA